ncbi:MAG: NUDIX domain-containing protein [Oleiphilaceae bacterium]|nr:NUDIX domain-containing protein [Oleiphilaceae bacterium]
MLSPDKFHYCPRCGTAMPGHGTAPLACPAEGCHFVYYNNPLPVVAAVVEVSGGVLLAHNRSWPPGLFGPVTGFLEAGESPDDAVIREAREELGLSLTLESLIGVYGFETQNQVIMAYHLRGKGTVTLNEELDEYRVIPVDRLKPWSFGTGLAIRDWLSTRKG